MKRIFVASGMSIGFALAALVIMASGLLINRDIGILAENEDRVLHTHRVIHLLDQIRLEANAAESSQRGYLITGERSYLARYESAGPAIVQALSEVAELTTDNPHQVLAFPEMAASVRQRMETLAEGIRIMDASGRDAGREFILQGKGLTQMNRMRDLIDDMKAEETRLLKLRNEQSVASRTSTTRMTVLSSIAGLAMVLTAYTLSVREIRSRQQQAAALEQRVQERTLELAATNLSLQQSNRELEQFASVASHDLQEPLRKIEAFGDRLRLRREALDDQSRDYLDRILNSASRMRTLINDLLSFSRVATRAQPFREVDLNQVAHEVVGDLESRLQQVQGAVTIGDLPKIVADPTQMRQLFQNLIGNALKFHRPDVPPAVQVTAERMVSETGGDLLRISVTDNGIGFEEQYLDRIFEVFQRLHGRNEFEGTGIGLAICRKIAERHGGSITARSRPGEGATFLVTLPVQQSEKESRCLPVSPS